MNNEHHEFYTNVDFLFKLAFLADVFGHMNELNLQLQGRNRQLYDMAESLQAFIRKLKLYRGRFADRDYTAFECTSMLIAEHGGAVQTEYYHPSVDEYMSKLIADYEDRFADIDVRAFDMLRFPFQSKLDGLPTRVAAQLIDMQSSAALKERFKELELTEFWLSLSDEYAELKDVATRHLVKFGSTYLCETAFSTMNLVKSKIRNRLTDDNLQDAL